jgi:alkanesulfonate monooxygenase SsuD/methylene tetrahydromethanopterin reductase-like flavin-dependent oxidoreductase (luciferase family)
MGLGIFSLSQVPDLDTTVESFDADMRLFQLAEDLGYDTIWLAEHLFSTYGLVTSTQVLAAAVAKATDRIRIGAAVAVIPFNHPLRTASDYALVDVLSHGRLDFGVGRAYQPHEFVGLGVPMEDSRSMFNEGMDVVLKAWEGKEFTHKGKHWTIPEPLTVLPHTVQKPHPPVWQATISPDSFTQAARRGWNLQFATPFTYRTYRDAWREKLAEGIATYETECRELGRDPKAARRMMLVPFFVHENGETAREIYGRHVQWFYDKVTTNATKGASAPVKGYELTMTEGQKTRELGYLSFDKLYELGACIADEPAVAVDKLQEYQDRFGITDFALWFNIGGIDVKHAEAAMRLTAAKVMPHVLALTGR